MQSQADRQRHPAQSRENACGLDPELREYRYEYHDPEGVFDDVEEKPRDRLIETLGPEQGFRNAAGDQAGKNQTYHQHGEGAENVDEVGLEPQEDRFRNRQRGDVGVERNGWRTPAITIDKFCGAITGVSAVGHPCEAVRRSIANFFMNVA